jgi:hypothetical protein
MKVPYSVMLLFLFCQGASAREQQPASVTIANYDSSGRVTIRPRLLIEKFEDGVPIERISVERNAGRYFLIMSGNPRKQARADRTRTASCRTDSIPLTDDGHGGLGLRASPVVINTCKGKNCSQCKYVEDSGCQCLEVGDPFNGNGSGMCEHTQTTTSGFAKLRNPPRQIR